MLVTIASAPFFFSSPCFPLTKDLNHLPSFASVWTGNFKSLPLPQVLNGRMLRLQLGFSGRAAHQCAENTLALRDGGHLLQGELSKAQLARYQGVHGQLPGGAVTRRGHVGGRRAERDAGRGGERMTTCFPTPELLLSN